MARSNFRGTTRTLYNPRNVKYLEAPEARKEYQALRRIALKRGARLEKAGLGYLPEAAPDFPASSLLSDDEIKNQLLDVSAYLRDPYSLVVPARELKNIPEEMERVTIRGRTQIRKKLPDMGEIINRNPKRFGKFMDEIRARASGRLQGSSQVRTAYEEALQRGMRPETLRKHFSDYLTDAEKADRMAATLYRAPKEGRLTISKLKALIAGI